MDYIQQLAHWPVSAKSSEIVQMGRVDGYNPQSGRKETAFTWTDIYEKEPTSSLPLGN